MSESPNSSSSSSPSNIMELQQLMYPNFDSDTDDSDTNDDDDDDDDDVVNINSHILIHKTKIILPPFLSPTAWESQNRRQTVKDEKPHVSNAVRSWINGENPNKPLKETSQSYRTHRATIKSYRKRRQYLRTLASEPGSYIDADMRLVPRRFPFQRRNHDPDENDDLAAAAVAQQRMPPHPPPPEMRNNGGGGGGLGFGLGLENDDDEERRVEEEREREASEAVERVVRRYREEGVAEDDFRLIRVPPRETDTLNLTFRRIFFAVLAVVTAFLCIMLQTLPIVSLAPPTEIDRLLHELMDVRDFHTHVAACDSLDRSGFQSKTKNVDCTKGVLHIPTVPTLRQSHPSSFTNGINSTWMHHCKLPPNIQSTPSCFPSRCFRGIHDNLIRSNEVDAILLMASYLINRKGGNHVEIRHDVEELQRFVPSVLRKLEQLLLGEYGTGKVMPVAFRVSVALPVDVQAWHYHGKDPLLVKAINRTTLMKWEETILQTNSQLLSLPTLLSSRPFRDPCILLSDLEACEEFAFHTSIFLSTSGEDFAGGTMLYLDDDVWSRNKQRRRKIQQGLVVEASRGRVVVSTGGEENRRCRLPTREGVRAVLQIWWGCGG